MKTKTRAKDTAGDFDTFKNFARQILSVPHSEIKAALDAENRKKRATKSASRASGERSNPT